MYYKVEQNTELYLKLEELSKKMKSANKEAFALCEYLGFKQFRGHSFALAGGISSFYSEIKPIGYKLTFGSKQPKDYFPKETAINKDLLAKIESLPIITYDELNDLINYDWREHVIGKQCLFHPGISFPENGTYLLSFSDWIENYKPVEGMIEITKSEFNKLNN